MRKIGFFLFVAVLLAALASAEAFAAIDVELAAPENMRVGRSFDAQLRLAGNDAVGAFDLRVAFDPALLRISGVAMKIAAMAPAQSKIDEANLNGSISFSFLDVFGSLVPGSGTEVASVTFECVSEGEITIRPGGKILTISGWDITGSMSPATVRIAASPTNGFADVELLSPEEVDAGDDFDVNVRLIGNERVGAFDLSVEFDPGLLRISGVVSGGDFSTPSPHETDEANESGTITLSGTTPEGLDPSGGVDVFVIRFHAVSPGRAAISPSGSITRAGSRPRDITGIMMPATLGIADSPADPGEEPTPSGIDVALHAQDSADSSFDLDILMTGTETIGAFTLHVNFDKDKIRITDISPASDGVVVPGSDGMAIVNAEGSFQVAYASMSGFVPGADPKVVAVVRCKPLADGPAVFGLSAETSVSGNGFPPSDITGNLSGKTVSVSKKRLTLEEIRKHLADYNEARNTDFSVGMPGDRNGNGRLDMGDILVGLKMLNDGR